ncbi:MAG: tryptophan synthase subunit beta [Euryarchaeota archaeon]|nr:tryptophan synthase subunit beta [Euryarchaeota archaeon]
MIKSYSFPDENGKFGEFGGKFAPETLIPALEELEEAYKECREDLEFQETLRRYLKDYAGRPTPLYFSKTLSECFGFKIYLKREDLVHGGAHKLNNTLGQALLTKKMGKERIIAETSAGQHGLAAATAGALLGLKTEIFMGKTDIKRQRFNALKIKLLGAEVVPVTTGSGVLKDAVNEALRGWVANVEDTHYLIGSTVGPHPFPMMVREFQSVIGKEMKKQIIEKEERLPDAIVACGSGGSNALGAFTPFITEDVELIFVEGGGEGIQGERHAAVFTEGRKGVLHGAYTFLLQDEDGQISKTYSRSAGLNYPARGPEISYLVDSGRARAVYATDREVLDAFKFVSEKEGIIPAFETCHALAHLHKMKGQYGKDDVVVVNFSGRGDKDVEIGLELLGVSL